MLSQSRKFSSELLENLAEAWSISAKSKSKQPTRGIESRPDKFSFFKILLASNNFSGFLLEKPIAVKDRNAKNPASNDPLFCNSRNKSICSCTVKKGLSMLENLIIKRGGLEGNNKSEYKDYLNQQEFEVFFQQIKPFLTVQEQIDLFLELQKRGSLEAGFLAFLSLTAIGFSRRKPEKLFEARRILKKLNLSGLDSMPLVGCLDLLLADIDQASALSLIHI